MEPDAAALSAALEESLDPLPEEDRARIATLVSKKLVEILGTEDLRATPDSELLAADTTQLSRLTYVSALLRVVDFLRRKPEDEEMRLNQAKVALGYIRHAESNRLAALQIGRNRNDDKLVEQVQDLRKEMDKLAGYKANVIAAKRVAAWKKS